MYSSPIKAVSNADCVDVGGLFGQLYIAFAFGDVDITVITVLETIIEIETYAFRYAPFYTCLCAHMADELVSVFLLVLGCIERVLQFAPYIWLDRLARYSELSTQTAALQPVILVLLQQVHAVRTHVTDEAFAQGELDNLPRLD